MRRPRCSRIERGKTMRRIKNLLLIILTLTLVSTGALLPHATAMVQDQQLEKIDDSRELEQVQLLIQKEMSTVQIFNLLGNEHTGIAWNSTTNLTEEEAMDYVFNTTKSMIRAGLLPLTAVNESYNSKEWLLYEQNGRTEPYLIISDNENQAAILWKCTWESPADAVYTMWIDDRTGMMCGMSRTAETNSESNTSLYTDTNTYSTATDITQLIMNWITFLNNDYGLQTWNINDFQHDNQQNESTLSLLLDVGEDEQNICSVRLKCEGKNIFFVI